MHISITANGLCMSPRSRILVAEDTFTIRAVVSRALTERGFSVVAVADGQEAWDMAQQERFDLVVTDEQMPRLSGRELCRRLRAHRDYARTPIIFLTGKAFDIDVHDLNIASVISKPFSPDQLAGEALKKVSGTFYTPANGECQT